MPELPEVETVRRQLEKKIVGKRITGRSIVGLRRRAKILIIDLDSGQSLIFHLKMTGQLIFNGKPSQYTRKVFNFDDGSRLVFNDVRKFGWWKMVKSTKKIEEKFGSEPLKIDLKTFRLLLKRRPKSRIKPLLMDQKTIAGIGNIYSDEILYAAEVNPFRRAETLKESEVRLIFRNMVRILTLAIKHRGSSVKDYLDASGKKGDFVKFHKVYQREGEKCARCGELIKRAKINGRSAHFCPVCQKQ
ncbi:MAG: DNA-formamidopyrimidine glycosylase [bacterium]|nr:DNA-formamidopyrimidine glycosylase [bacterium]